MARGKAISVKIATTKVIKALETKLAQLQKEKKEQANNEAKYDKAYKSWQKEVGKACVAQISKAEDISANTRYNGEVSVSFSIPKGLLDLPEAPEKDYNSYHDWQFKEMIGEIENAIRILKMTDEEVVSTSSYNAIAQYL